MPIKDQVHYLQALRENLRVDFSRDSINAATGHSISFCFFLKRNFLKSHFNFRREIFHKQPKPQAENRMHEVNWDLSKISPWNYIINKLSKLRSHLVYIAPRNNAQIWINSDIWSSFSHRTIPHICMAYYFWDVTRDWCHCGDVTNARDKQTVLCLCSFQIIELAVAMSLNALDFTVCYDLTKVRTLQLCGLSEHVDVAFITNQKWLWLLSDRCVLWKVLV